MLKHVRMSNLSLCSGRVMPMALLVASANTVDMHSCLYEYDAKFHLYCSPFALNGLNESTTPPP